MERIEKLRILIYSENNLPMLKLSVENYKIIAQYVPIELYIVDNFSNDGTAQWLEEQDNLSYVIYDEGRVLVSKLINEAFEVFEIKENVLIIQPQFMANAQTIRNLFTFIEKLPLDACLVGVHGNTFRGDQRVEMKNCMEYAQSNTDKYSDKTSYFREISIDHRAFVLVGDIYSRIGSFDENLEGEKECMKDYCFRCILADEKVILPTQTIPFYDISGGLCIPDTNEFQNQLRAKWGANYFGACANTNLSGMIVEGEKTNPVVLEIGCDTGAALLAVKNRIPEADVYGVEINEFSTRIAQHFAKVSCNDINKEFPFGDLKFDYIIFGDVLEHLPNPKQTLMNCKEHLRDDGYILASIPNLMHIFVMQQLLKGYFTYTDMGLLDKTHIHFFTYFEMLKMFDEAGLSIEYIGCAEVPISKEDEQLIDVLLMFDKKTEKFMFKTFQYVVKARRKSST